MLSEDIVSRLAAIEREVARSHGLSPSADSSGRDVLRSVLERLARDEAAIEARVTVDGPAHQALLVGLGERYGVPVYRRPRQRATTLMLSGPRTFIHEVMGPIFQQMSDALDAWFLNQTQDILQHLDERSPLDSSGRRA